MNVDRSLPSFAHTHAVTDAHSLFTDCIFDASI